MGKFLGKFVFLILFLSCQFASAQSTTGSCTNGVVSNADGFGSPTITTQCTTNQTSGPGNNNSLPQYSGGPSAADLAKKKEAEKKGCFDSVKKYFNGDCEAKTESIYRDSMSSCNTGVAVGAVVASLGAGGLAGVAIVASVVALPVAIVGAIAFTVVSAGGTYVAMDNQFQCKEQVEWNKKDNLKICANNIANAQQLACAQYL